MPEKGAYVRILIAFAGLVAGTVADLALEFADYVLCVLFIVVVVLFANMLLVLAAVSRLLRFPTTPPH